MAKLPAAKKTFIQPEVPNLIHDIILSLCQRKYSGISNVEVDGIICISLQGTAEQQVIKIHESLIGGSEANKIPTVEDEVKSKATKGSSEIHVGLDLEVDSINEQDKPDQTDEISNHNSEDTNNVDQAESNNFRNDISFLSSLLKTTSDMIGNDSITSERKDLKGNDSISSERKDLKVKIVKKTKHDTKEKVSKRKRKQPVHHPKKSPKKACTDDSLTDEYAQSLEHVNNFDPNMVIVKQEVPDEETLPKEVDVYSSSNINPHGETFDPGSMLSNNNEQNSCHTIDDRHGQKSLHEEDSFHRASSVERQRGIEPFKQFTDPPDDENTNLKIIIKEEKVDDSEFGAAYGETKESDPSSEMAALYYNYGDDPDYSPYTEGHSQGYSSSDSRSSAKNYSEPARQSITEKEKEDSAASKWFETVRSNMNRYQAALIRSRKITKKGSEADKGLSGPSVHTNLLDGKVQSDRQNPSTEDSPTLKRILQRAQEENVLNDSPDSETPIVVKTENVEEPKADEPKLGFKYPALFSQLQKHKTAESNSDAASQADSLVNRLPFLSFKDLFSQASNGSSPAIDLRPSPERLINLLSQPSAAPQTQLNYAGHLPDGATGYRKKAWNWKRRAVRPKGPNGEILTQFPARLANSEKPNIPVGIANPKRKAKSKDKDKDWQPHSTHARDSVTTRRSSSRLPRTDFTEFSESDIEEIDIDEDNDPSELVPLYCRYSCGARFEDVNALRDHEETCGQCGGGKDFQCELCGLDFNQQYRWQYHMIKVHGVSVTSGMFR